ncbi:MAG: inner membrane protein YhjD [Mycobacterium sp.]
MRARFPWLDHAWRAQERYRDSKGNHFAAGVTYFTIFALFPLLMLGFSAAGFLLASRPDLLSSLQDRIRRSVSGDMGQQLVQLMNQAIESRASVGVVGLATALWVGLGWMSNLREALSEMWEQTGEDQNFLRTKLSDLVRLLSVFLAIAVTVALTALGSRRVMRGVLGWLGMGDMPGIGVLLQVASVAVSVGISWLFFTWVIARLPRESLTLASSARAGLLAAVGFEVFKQLGSIYLGRVMQGPAGATFGPVFGLLVFAYVTARLLLFATAWAATATERPASEPVAPEPVFMAPRESAEGIGLRAAFVAGALGALGGLGLSRLLRRRR